MLRNKWRLISIGLLAVIAIIAGAIYAAHPNADAEVRVGAKRHDDGRVEVALQQRDAEGGWGELQRPDARFLPADVTGEWRMSSPVAVASAMAASDAMGAMPDAPTGSDNLYCVIHHGADDDPFWINFDTVVRTNAWELGLSNVEIHSTTDISEHAAAIMDCADRGAWGVASSIPDLDGLRDALIAVRTSGAFLVTFNSGDEVAGLVGSTVHYGLNDRVAGELAGREFNTAGATGTLLCVIHEEVNLALPERCEGLESVYGGSVVQVTLPAGSLTDPIASGRAIGEAIVANQAVGVLVLNGGLINTAIGVVDFLGSDALVGAIGRSQFALVQVYEGQLLFAIDDGSNTQASHVMLSLKNVDSSPSIRAMLATTALQAAETTTMLIRPWSLNQEYISNFPEGWQEQICALAMQLAPDQAPAFCQQ